MRLCCFTDQAGPDVSKERTAFIITRRVSVMYGQINQVWIVNEKQFHKVKAALNILTLI